MIETTLYYFPIVRMLLDAMKAVRSRLNIMIHERIRIEFLLRKSNIVDQMHTITVRTFLHVYN